MSLLFCQNDHSVGPEHLSRPVRSSMNDRAADDVCRNPPFLAGDDGLRGPKKADYYDSGGGEGGGEAKAGGENTVDLHFTKHKALILHYVLKNDHICTFCLK